MQKIEKILAAMAVGAAALTGMASSANADLYYNNLYGNTVTVLAGSVNPTATITEIVLSCTTGGGNCALTGGTTASGPSNNSLSEVTTWVHDATNSPYTYGTYIGSPPGGWTDWETLTGGVTVTASGGTTPYDVDTGSTAYSIWAFHQDSYFVAVLFSAPVNMLEFTTPQGGISGVYAFDPTVVPLPPAALLFGTALVGMGLLSRRRRKIVDAPMA